jgi:lipopolysaccharide export system permease protein
MIYKRYLFNQVAQIFGVTIFVMTSIVILGQFLKLINQYISKGLDISNILLLLVLVLPSLLVYVAPIGIFCAIFFVYHKLIIDNELIVLEAVGISKIRLAIPTMILAVIITLVSYTATIFLIPYFKRELHTQQRLLRENFISSMLEEKVFNTLSKDLVIYIDEQKSDGNLHGTIIYDQRDKAVPTIIIAQTAKLIPNSDSLLIELYHGSRQHLNNNGQLETLFFDSFSLIIDYQKMSEVEHHYTPDELYINELFFKPTDDQILKNTMRYEIHNRLSWPLLNLAMAGIAVSTILSISYNRHWKYKRAIIGVTAAIVLILLNFIFISKSEKSLIFTILLYLNLISATALSYYVLKQHSSNLEVIPPKINNSLKKLSKLIYSK